MALGTDRIVGNAVMVMEDRAREAAADSAGRTPEKGVVSVSDLLHWRGVFALL